eukprot:scaffold42954_cov74-Phaeocystis_antarctica.AAC.14
MPPLPTTAQSTREASDEVCVAGCAFFAEATEHGMLFGSCIPGQLDFGFACIVKWLRDGKRLI